MSVVSADITNSGKWNDYTICTAAKTYEIEQNRLKLTDVADWFWGWQQLTNYRDPEKKIDVLAKISTVFAII